MDAGIQGTTYGFSGDKSFASASVVLEWTLFDGLTTHRRVQRRRLETKRLRTRRNRVERQLTQKVHKTLEEVRVARQSLQTARFNRENAVIEAPESGRILRRHAEAGEHVAPGTPVLTLGATGRGWVCRKRTWCGCRPETAPP